MSNYSYLFKLIVIGDTSKLAPIKVLEKAVCCYSSSRKSSSSTMIRQSESNSDLRLLPLVTER